MNNVYIVKCNYNGDNPYTKVNQICYTSKDKAIEFIKSRLSSKEIEVNEIAQRRNLQAWYEFLTKKYDYIIEVLNVE